MLHEYRPLALPGADAPKAKARGVLEVLFRQRRVALITFFGILLGTSAAVLLMPKQYRSEMKVLIRRERVDPVVSPEAGVQARFVRGLTEQEINSEVDLLQSRDLLEKVVIQSGLDQQVETGGWFGSDPAEDELDRRQKVALAVRDLEEHLNVEPPNKSNLITVSYRSPDPELSARVLNTLAELYLEKHLAVHRPAGTLEFFEREASQYKQELDGLQQRLLDFGRREGVVSADVEKDSAVQTLTRFEATQRELQASIAETQQRIHSLQQQAAETPARVVTQVRTRSDLLAQLSETLFNLQRKRTEMLAKYAPTYRPVVDLEKQIEETQAAIAQAERAPIREEITDENPIYKWLSSELARAHSELAALKARSAANARNIEAYREKAQQLGQKNVEQQELLRAAKAAEENYSLYLRKQEEARMADALDKERIVNVAIAENATVPLLPDSRPGTRLLAGLLMALLVSVGMAFLKDYWDPSFRTPDEVRMHLNLPVLAAIPHPQYLLPAGSDEHQENREEVEVLAGD